ncbi:MAG: DinB family protein [Hyphomicrobiales bacterium]
MKARYVMFAGYNRWANARLYDAASKLPDADYRADRGAYFKSMHGTLNHMLVADRIWMKRFTGTGETTGHLDAILFQDFVQLLAARTAEDDRITRYIDSLTDVDLAGHIRYRTITKPTDIEQELSPALDHFFNHQTHHRGQAHGLLTALTGDAPSFDLIIFQRESGQGGLRKLE